MNPLVSGLQKEATKTLTENGAKTFSSSLNACLDLFFMGGAFRKRSEQDCINLFMKAYYEDKALALQILAYIRDCRGGMGERRFFRVVTKYLASKGEKFNIQQIPILGRWDDILELLDTSLESSILSTIAMALDDEDGLCAKWMPRQGKVANKLRNYLSSISTDGIVTPKDYRRQLVDLTKVVETQMCNNDWDKINYSHVPSIANVKYNKAFFKHDQIRREEFINSAIKGDVKINSSVAFPDDVLYKTGVRGDWKTAIAMWNQLPNYLKDSNVRFLPVCDVSGSMSGRPMEVSVSLGIYLSERNNSAFKDAFITFSSTPKLQYLKGDLQERYNQLRRAEWTMSTNLEAVFKLILATAYNSKVSAEDMPTHILIISDMEFNQASKDTTSYKQIKADYKKYGYEMPNIIFWNVNSRQDNVPVRFTTDNVGLVSGASPAVLKAVLSGNINPIDIMLRAVDQDKYRAFIA